MKKIIYLLSFTFLILQSCSSSDSNNNNSDNNNNGSVTDIDDNVYQTVTICDQVWTKKNLNVSRYRNGDVIPQVTNPTQWANLTTGAWCYYNNDPANGAIYGKLYNWYAVNDLRGLAPSGYHIPTDAEWNTLTDCLGGEFIAGGKMKESGTTHWNSPNIGATNSSGFTGLPGGVLDNMAFKFINEQGYWWSSTEYTPGSSSAWAIDIFSTSEEFGKPLPYKNYGLSVRCIKD
jgi:uncharacterized protein (TIGR02145 family)